MAPITRRQLIGGFAGLTALGPRWPMPASGLTIQPRSSWGSDRPPKGPLHPEDVRFLIVHHSASRNGHTSADVPEILRGWFDYHTGPAKGWNDVAYNFVIDSEGAIWEARQGSLDGPVAGDATGGNQGFSQLVCVIGDYDTAQPTPASLSSLVVLLAWLADRYGVSTTPESTVTFTSEGSNKWPSGTSVTTRTITGHRTMSKTSCPGDNLNAYVEGALMTDVQAVRTGGSFTPTTQSTSPPTTSPPTTSPPTTTPASSTTSAHATSTQPPTTTPSSAATLPSTSSTAPALTTTMKAPATTIPTTAPLSTSSSTASPSIAAGTTTTLPVASGGPVSGGANPVLIGAGTAIALTSGLLIWRYNRLNR